VARALPEDDHRAVALGRQPFNASCLGLSPQVGFTQLAALDKSCGTSAKAEFRWHPRLYSGAIRKGVDGRHKAGPDEC
jgi:hypothetical protein